MAELELAAVHGRGGGDAGDAGRTTGTVLPNSPFPVELAAEMMMSAWIVLLTLLVAELDSEGAEHGDGRDERQPDHQRRRRLSRAPGAAHGVLPAQPARGAEQAGQRAADNARHGLRRRRQMATPTKISTAPRPTSWMVGFVNPYGQQHDPIAVMTRLG